MQKRKEYLKNIKFGDKRIILINGKPEGAINRIPSENDIRANLHVGGKATKTVISNKEMKICESIGPELIQRGLLLVGIDIIGNLPFMRMVNPKQRTEMTTVYSTWREFSFAITPGFASLFLFFMKVQSLFIVMGLFLISAGLLSKKMPQ